MRRIMVIILCALFLLAGSTSAEVWEDDFEGGELGKDWMPATWCLKHPPPDWKIEDGILRGKWPSWGAQMLFLLEHPSLDYTIQVKCRIDKVWQAPSLAGAGFIFRSSGPGAKIIDGCISNFYSWGIGSDRSAFMDSGDEDGTWQVIESVPKNHDLAQWYTLKLVVAGNRFLGYVNDKPACGISSSKYKGKFVGIFLGANIDASFDDFTITDRIDDADLSDVVPEGMVLTTTWANLKEQ